MKKLLTLLLGVITMNIALGQWYSLNSGTTGNLMSVCFPVPDTGYVVGYDVNPNNYDILFKTMDGGDEWIPLEPGITNDWFTSVFFSDVDTGYLLSYGGKIERTFNGGIDWTNIHDFQFGGSMGYSVYPNSIYFSDTLHGFFVTNIWSVRPGSFGEIYHSDDGGLNWPEPFWFPIPLSCLFFPDDSTGYAVGFGGAILKTTDAGVNWIPQNTGINNPLTSVHFADNNTGYAVGHTNYPEYNGVILKTTDGGLNWVVSKSCVDTSFNSVCFVNENKGYVVGYNGVILTTSDGGATWTVQNSGTTNNLTAVCFPGPETGYIIGDGGIILKTTNGGTPVGTENELKNSGNVTIYPNPSRSKITLETSLNSVHLSILSLNGLPLIERRITETITILEISTLAPGIYFVRVQDDKMTEVMKLVKQ
jgi:photosystem II stability/assembly factor-like uncharacterized protein